MRASWVALHTSVSRILYRCSAEAAFQKMGKTHPILARFASIASLMEHQQAHEGDPADRFSVVRALVAAAQSDQSYRPTAHLLVLLALWPGLDAVLWRLGRGFPAARDDLPGDILVRSSEAILSLDLDRVSAVASTILRNVERDIRRDLVAQRMRGHSSQPIDDLALGQLSGTIGVDATIDDRMFADHLSGLKSEDAHLLRRVFILGETQEEAGQFLGLSHAAARKRFQRAIAKLQAQQKNFPTLSHSASPVGL